MGEWKNQQERTDRAQQAFEKYVPGVLEMIIEGIVDGKQGEKLKTIVPQTALNMVSNNLQMHLEMFP